VYDQSIVLGLLEERRIFMLWYFYPLVFHARGFQNLARTLIGVGFLVVTLGLLYRIGVIGGFKEIAISEIDGRFGRANFSGTTIVILTLFALGLVFVRNARERILSRKYALIFFFLGVSFVVFATQTRQFILALAISTIFFFLFGKIDAKLKLFFIYFILLVFLLILSASGSLTDLSIGSKFSEIFDLEKLQHSVRFSTISSIMRESEFWGNGALSGQYTYGFHYLYGENFFLADVGPFGTMFRYGILSVPCFAMTAYFMAFIWRSMQDKATIMAISLCLGVISLILQWPGAAILEYRGNDIAVLLALAVTLNAQPKASEL
jgi:hypothetical protein